jgi:hypothetical protein
MRQGGERSRSISSLVVGGINAVAALEIDPKTLS